MSGELRAARLLFGITVISVVCWYFISPPGDQPYTDDGRETWPKLIGGTFGMVAVIAGILTGCMVSAEWQREGREKAAQRDYEEQERLQKALRRQADQIHAEYREQELESIVTPTTEDRL